ncbi:hypothetical protein CJ177_33750 [Rhodococcus sp. ACPA1]|nr:hypothetical protein CJ177_33750 [Rhodococcus sp. ACPA1]
MLLTAGQVGDNPSWRRCSSSTRIGTVAPCGCSRTRCTPIPRLGNYCGTTTSRTRSRNDPIRSHDGRRRGSRGGRPPAFDAVLYRHRNTVERGFNRLKHWRGVATRYDKYAITYLGGVLLASTITTHRLRN